MQEAAAQTWSVRTLQRNIDSQYYYRLLRSQHKELVEIEMLEITSPSQVPDRLEFVKNPVVAEFLGLESRSEFNENTLEGAIITNLQKFLMELGKGFAFVARQRRQQGQYCCDSLQSYCSLTVWISHQPFRLPFFLTIIPFWEREAMIRLTVRSDFPMDVAISFWSIRLFLEMQSNTARSSKVTFKVPFWPFG